MNEKIALDLLIIVLGLLSAYRFEQYMKKRKKRRERLEAINAKNYKKKR